MSSTSTTVRPVAGTGLPEKAAAALVNFLRLASVMQRLRLHIQAGPKSDIKEFQICCISLAKGIDFAIANNEIPKKVEELPSLLKQLCRHRNDVYTKTTVMVLMISIKHSCKLGWFSDSEGQELIALADEMKSSFGSSGNSSSAIKSPGGTLSQIMERFYPFVKLGHVLVYLEVKAGYTMLAHDFHISKNMPHSPQERIRLFVVQTENIDTSACIINPPEVSFLLNGKVVEMRVNISMVCAVWFLMGFCDEDINPNVPMDVPTTVPIPTVPSGTLTRSKVRAVQNQFNLLVEKLTQNGPSTDATDVTISTKDSTGTSRTYADVLTGREDNPDVPIKVQRFLDQNDELPNDQDSTKTAWPLLREQPAANLFCATLGT